ncbi:rhodanese-like domain-containing protein [Desulfopila aestuarii]|uniref:Rhodanese-related sulfurtransferase n=1 Tax=Desulfopila aestuarii DSM 18488 TaxID=1121416 RepID=A0A1M7YDA7_9BACT|nr:rhodanese-like domain-containing protein [Desulfopila aestuarii]SHO50569.1 Rhodanese-related sulfurtransferase [Desulfopila aestuarii DSM 18488]
MNWMSLFAKSENISPEETRNLRDKYPPDSFQLLDVRQPKEYEQAHIPGARLIPLGELPQRLDELDRDREIIVYCRSGVRSKSGYQILNSAGFSRVLNMTGGINGWQGHKAIGSEELGLDFFTSGDFSSAVSMALTMEMGLRRFYQLLADSADDDSNRELLEYMARLEDGHMAKLKTLLPSTDDSVPDTSSVAEGGFNVTEFLATYGDQLKTIETILHTGMRFEAQAYDMYSRLATKEQHADLREFYLQMAAEEQTHLKRLARELDQRLG